MSDEIKAVSVAMVRGDLDDIPDFPLAEPFKVRWYQPGDEVAWTRIHTLADMYTKVTDDLFGRQFGSDAEILAKRQCYLCDEWDVEVGTATAWFDDDYRGQPHGRLHWVAIAPYMQRRGLSKPLLSVVLGRMRELGHERVYLTTGTQRLPAINLYLKFGFLPDPRNDQELEAWRQVRTVLGADFHLPD